MSLHIQKVDAKKEILKKKTQLQVLRSIFSDIRKLSEKLSSFEEQKGLEKLFKPLDQ